MKPADPSTHEKPGHKFESMFTVDDRSCTVVVCSVDLATVVSEFNLHLYSKSDTLIKYSEARFSPVSSQPADHIRLATPSYYRDLEAGENSELIADDREGAYIESLRLNQKSVNQRKSNSPIVGCAPSVLSRRRGGVGSTVLRYACRARGQTHRVSALERAENRGSPEPSAS